MKHHHDIHIMGVCLLLGSENGKHYAQMPTSALDILDENCQPPLSLERVKTGARNEA